MRTRMAQVNTASLRQLVICPSHLVISEDSRGTQRMVLDEGEMEPLGKLHLPAATKRKGRNSRCVNGQISKIGIQCSQRGSPSVLSQNEDGRQFVVPSGHFLKLPDK